MSNKHFSRVAAICVIALSSLTVRADSTIAPPALSPATSGQPIGEGQAWRYPYRVKGAVYQNTMGRPIMVHVVMNVEQRGGCSRFYIDYNLMGQDCNGSSTDHGVSFSFIIPHGSVYYVSGIRGRDNVQTWAELY